ncbi:MAG: hypothetical protein HW401_569 [Parcubacteria group bacterium]|nr:hypothetical protein [Parcubacteria group bacterium]
MKGGIQCIENFFAQGTLGAAEGKSLESVTARMNGEGWKVDQIVPLTFRPAKFGNNGGMDVTSGILLCSKLE